MEKEFNLYNTQNIESVFKDNFVGPEKLEHGIKTLIAKYENEGEDKLINLNIYATSYPATFFDISLILNEHEIILSTCSGDLSLTKKLVDLITNGSLNIEFKSIKVEQ